MKNLERVKKSDKLMLDLKKKTVVYRINIFFFFSQITSKSVIYIRCLLALNGCHSADKYRLLLALNFNIYIGCLLALIIYI